MIKLFNLFDYTGDKDHFIDNEELREIVLEVKIPFTLKKCKMLLRTKGCIEHRTQTKRGLVGLKLKTEKEEENKIDFTKTKII